MKNNFVIMF